MRTLHQPLLGALLLITSGGASVSGASPASAATIGPPMLDVAHQCSLNSRRNVTAMSECIVAESEARAEILQKWHKVSDANADRCVKLGRKNQKYPYTTIAKCLAGDVPAPIVPPVAPAAKK